MFEVIWIMSCKLQSFLLSVLLLGTLYFHEFNLHAIDEMGDNSKRDTMTCGKLDHPDTLV